MKSSCHSLIPSCHFFSITLGCHLQNWTHSRQQLTQMNSSSSELFQLLITHSNDLLCPFRTPWHAPQRKHSLSTFEACLLIRCIAMDVLLLRAYASAGICLPSRCLAMGLYVTILIGPLSTSKQIPGKIRPRPLPSNH
jgi:hypothetical protein